jgi:hypothetical protein
VADCQRAHISRMYLTRDPLVLGPKYCSIQAGSARRYCVFKQGRDQWSRNDAKNELFAELILLRPDEGASG